MVVDFEVMTASIFDTLSVAGTTVNACSTAVEIDINPCINDNLLTFTPHFLSYF